MQYYVDTNILFFLFKRSIDDISNVVKDIIFDYSNTIYTSSVCIMELIQIFQTEKTKSNVLDNIFNYLQELNISVKCVTLKHLNEMTAVPVLHSDPNDRLIIAQAASDKITLISSDSKFPQYTKSLKDFKFVLNKR